MSHFPEWVGLCVRVGTYFVRLDPFRFWEILVKDTSLRSTLESERAVIGLTGRQASKSLRRHVAV